MRRGARGSASCPDLASLADRAHKRRLSLNCGGVFVSTSRTDLSRQRLESLQTNFHLASAADLDLISRKDASGAASPTGLRWKPKGWANPAMDYIASADFRTKSDVGKGRNPALPVAQVKDRLPSRLRSSQSQSAKTALRRLRSSASRRFRPLLGGLSTAGLRPTTTSTVAICNLRFHVKSRHTCAPGGETLSALSPLATMRRTSSGNGLNKPNAFTGSALSHRSIARVAEDDRARITFAKTWHAGAGSLLLCRSTSAKPHPGIAQRGARPLFRAVSCSARSKHGAEAHAIVGQGDDPAVLGNLAFVVGVRQAHWEAAQRSANFMSASLDETRVSRHPTNSRFRRENEPSAGFSSCPW